MARNRQRSQKNIFWKCCACISGGFLGAVFLVLGSVMDVSAASTGASSLAGNISEGLEFPSTTAGYISAFPWWGIGAVLIGAAVFLQWLGNNRRVLFRWRYCGVLPRPGHWLKLFSRLWLALFAGIFLQTVVTSVCAPTQGLIFSRQGESESRLFLAVTKPMAGILSVDVSLESVDTIGVNQTNSSFVFSNQNMQDLFRYVDFSDDPLDLPLLQGSYPVWSPDGHYLAYTASPGDIYLYHRETGEITPLTGASEPNWVETMPAWSPDGMRLAFVRRPANAQEQFGQIAILSFADGQIQYADEAGEELNKAFPVFSPDGKWLAYIKQEQETIPVKGAGGSIYLLAVDGGREQPLAAKVDADGLPVFFARNLSWSLDGKQLYFSALGVGDQFDLYTAWIDDYGNTNRVERISSISDPRFDETFIQETVLFPNSLGTNLINLWGWLVPFLILLPAAWLLARSSAPEKIPHTIEVITGVEPPRGFLSPKQRFEVSLDLIGHSPGEHFAGQRRVDVVLLIDSSSSMEMNDLGRYTRMQAVKRVGKHLGTCIADQNERIALVSFGSRVKVNQAFTNKKDRFVKGLESLRSEGATAMHQGIEKAVLMLTDDGRLNAHKVIILVSDGLPYMPEVSGFNASEAARSAAKIAREKGIRLITIGFGETDRALLQEISGKYGKTYFVEDGRQLSKAFTEISRELTTPIPASQIKFTHEIDADAFRIIPDTIFPPPITVTEDRIVWEINELAEIPQSLKYQVQPLQMGVSLKIDRKSQVNYRRCGQEGFVQLQLSPQMIVEVEKLVAHVPPPMRKITRTYSYHRPELVWKPDKALFIGIGGTGRHVLTFLRKNLLDAGGGDIPVGQEFLVIDAGVHEKLSISDFPFSSAGEVPDQDIFILDENLINSISEWAEQPIRTEHQGWFSANDYLGADAQLNLAAGTHGRRELARVALLRSLSAVDDIASQWRQEQIQSGVSPHLPDWIEKRCVQAVQGKTLRVFIVASLAGGMSGILLDLANLVREIGRKMLPAEGRVQVEGYFLDGLPFETLPGGPDAGLQRLANAFAATRELARWQLNPGLPLSTGWKNGSKVTDSPFDDVIIFSGNQAVGGNLIEKEYPMMADVITLRLDRKTKAGTDADWFAQMRKARSDRQRNDHVFSVGSAGAYTLRVPVTEILEALCARWASELLQTFVTGSLRAAHVWDEGASSDPGFQAEPENYVEVLLLGSDNFGGQAPVESEAMADYLLKGESVLAAGDVYHTWANKPLDEVEENFERRLASAVKMILQGSAESLITGSRASRVIFARRFLLALEEKTRQLCVRLEGDWEKPELALFAKQYSLIAAKKRTHLEGLMPLLSCRKTGQPVGVLEKAIANETHLSKIKSRMDRIRTRRYLWGRLVLGEDGKLIEKEFYQAWWDQYFEQQVVNHLDLLAWQIDKDDIDLVIQYDQIELGLQRDGINAFLAGLVKYAEQLTLDLRNKVSLSDILQSQRILDSFSDGQEARACTDLAGIAKGDAGMSPGRILMIAPQQLLDSSRETPFLDGLKQNSPGEVVSVRWQELEGADRLSATVIRLQDAMWINRMEGYGRALFAYDRLDDGGMTRAVTRCEGEARLLEKCEDYLFNEHLHPYIVMALENPEMAELFCLALADGLISDNSRRGIGLKAHTDIQLLLTPRRQVDSMVDALLHWSLLPHTQNQQKAVEWMRERFKSSHDIDRSRLRLWKTPQPPFTTGKPDRRSLGHLTTVLVRQFLRNKTRRWE
jgi:uncharacterized protein YegL